MPSSKFSKPPVNEARPLGTPRPSLVKRIPPPKKPALVVESEHSTSVLDTLVAIQRGEVVVSSTRHVVEPVTFEQAVDILASTHDESSIAVPFELDASLVDTQTDIFPNAEDFSRSLALSACNDNPSDVVSAVAVIKRRQSRIRNMEAPATIVITASAWTEPKVFTLDTKARKGVTNVVYTSDEVRGSVRLSKSVFAEPKAAKAPRVKMSKEEATAARNAGRLAAKNLTFAEKRLRIEQAVAKRLKKLEAEEQKKNQPQLVTA